MEKEANSENRVKGKSSSREEQTKGSKDEGRWSKRRVKDEEGRSGKGEKKGSAWTDKA